ncbi:MAG TPA: LytR C-terminal domain-containing protein [Pilimelia sp.]|nr:LytR C-terminal domain-containing protein [Pilimelia sp.]
MSFARVRALVVVGVLSIAAIVFVVVAVVRDSQSEATAVDGCPAGYVVANVELPEPKQVRLRLTNATNTPGLGRQVANDFRNRRFQVDGRVVDAKQALEGNAALRFGPKAVGAAQLVAAYFLDDVERFYDRNRKDNLVDVVIGTEFQQLGTTTEVNQSIGALGKPAVPKGACAATS